MTWYVPVTPGGTVVFFGQGALMGKPLSSKSREKAISNLLKDAAHMPYGTWENFQKRGYTIEESESVPSNGLNWRSRRGDKS